MTPKQIEMLREALDIYIGIIRITEKNNITKQNDVFYMREALSEALGCDMSES